MSWRIVAVVGLLAVSASADAQKKSIGTIIFGNETFEIVYAAAHKNPVMDAVAACEGSVTDRQRRPRPRDAVSGLARPTVQRPARNHTRSARLRD